MNARLWTDFSFRILCFTLQEHEAEPARVEYNYSRHEQSHWDPAGGHEVRLAVSCVIVRFFGFLQVRLVLERLERPTEKSDSCPLDVFMDNAVRVAQVQLRVQLLAAWRRSDRNFQYQQNGDHQLAHHEVVQKRQYCRRLRAVSEMRRVELDLKWNSR